MLLKIQLKLLRNLMDACEEFETYLFALSKDLYYDLYI